MDDRRERRSEDLCPPRYWIDAVVALKAETGIELTARYQPVATTRTPDVRNRSTEMSPKTGYLTSEGRNAAFAALRLDSAFLAENSSVIVRTVVSD